MTFKKSSKPGKLNGPIRKIRQRPEILRTFAKDIATENQNLKAEIQTLHDAYGMTGENISRKIFSYLDIFSLMRGRRVSKTWNQEVFVL